MSRDTRLLLVTIALSAIVLLVLSRFRFPGEAVRDAAAPPPAAAPLERIAARATYDELAGIVAGVQQDIAPLIEPLRIDRPRAPVSLSVGDFVTLPEVDAPRRAALAVRLRPDLAVALLPAGARVQAFARRETDVPVVLARDPVRRLTLIRVPPGDGIAARSGVLDPTRYVIVVEPTHDGHSVRPLYIGTADRISDPRWPQPLVVLGPSPGVSQGAMIFSLDGRLLGVSVVESGIAAVVPAPALVSAAEALERSGTRQVGDIGVRVQPLTPALSRALGAPGGAVVAAVDPRGPARDRLRVSDVITHAGGTPVGVESLLLTIAQTAPGETISLSVRRGQASEEVLVETVALDEDSPGAPADLGVVVAARAGAGLEVVAVAADGAARAGGIRQGDLVTSIGGEPATSPSALTRAWRSLPADAALVLGVSREGAPLVLAVER